MVLEDLIGGIGQIYLTLCAGQCYIRYLFMQSFKAAISLHIVSL